MRTVYHNRRKACVYTIFKLLERALFIQSRSAVIKVEHKIHSGILHRGIDERGEIGGFGVFARSRRYLQDDRAAELCRCFSYSLHDLHVVDIKCADGVSAGVGFFKHFGSCYKCHFKSPREKYLYNYSNCNICILKIQVDFINIL